MTLKEQRLNLTKGRCEICGGIAVTAHHCFTGRKQRKISERIETLRAVCNECHAHLHNKGFDLLKQLKVEACQELIKKIGEDETLRILGRLYFNGDDK
jgi:hypothetical protein